MNTHNKNSSTLNLPRLVMMVLVALTVSSTLVQCAKRGRPSGGVKDSIPPVLVRALPQNMTTEFEGEGFNLEFDEFVQVKNLQQQVVVSPPLNYPIEVYPTLRASKKFQVRFKDTLAPNTTYSVNFGNALVDFNEGNPYPYLTYIFSTGAAIDSLSLEGTLKDAQLPKPDNFVSVMLYKRDSTFTDSTVYQKPPRYITNTLDSLKTFALKYLEAGTYELIGLKDANKNNRFDPLVDKIGFFNRPVQIPADSASAPVLTLFQEIPDARVLSTKLESPNRILVAYQGAREELTLRRITALPDSVPMRVLPVQGKDSLEIWHGAFEADSLAFVASNTRTGWADTLVVKMRKLKADTLVLAPVNRKNVLPTSPWRLQANVPITKTNPAKILVLDKDTLALPVRTDIDTLANQLILNFPITTDQNYRVQLYPGALTDLLGHTNDTVQYKFSVNPPEDFGTLKVIPKTLRGGPATPVLVQLLNNDFEVERQQSGPAGIPYTFAFLEPKKYWIRIVEDTNQNEAWDTGAYLMRRQPEPVHYFSEQVNVRPNWEIEQVVDYE